MTAMVSNPQHSIQSIKSANLVGILKAIVPRSFEKTFDGIPLEAINQAIKICIRDLTREQILTGLNTVRDSGFCPDPAMFRKWCLGITGFHTEQQRAADSFKRQHAALSNVIKWFNNKNHPITNAEKEAYDRCSEMFCAIQSSKDVERACNLAYQAFKDNYIDVVKEYVEKGKHQAIWKKPTIVEKKILADYGDGVELKPHDVLKGDELKKCLEEAKRKIKRGAE